MSNVEVVMIVQILVYLDKCWVQKTPVDGDRYQVHHYCQWVKDVVHGLCLNIFLKASIIGGFNRKEYLKPRDVDGPVGECEYQMSCFNHDQPINNDGSHSNQECTPKPLFGLSALLVGLNLYTEILDVC